MRRLEYLCTLGAIDMKLISNFVNMSSHAVRVMIFHSETLFFQSFKSNRIESNPNCITTEQTKRQRKQTLFENCDKQTTT